jgi:hypothetical protein
MMVDVKELVREYYNMGFGVQEVVAVLNISFNSNYTWDQVADMYMEIECEEEGK